MPTDVTERSTYFHAFALTEAQKELFRNGVLLGIGAMQGALRPQEGVQPVSAAEAEHITAAAMRALKAARILIPDHPRAETEGFWDADSHGYVLYETPYARVIRFPEELEPDALSFETRPGDTHPWEHRWSFALQEAEEARMAADFFAEHHALPTEEFVRAEANASRLNGRDVADYFWAAKYGLIKP